MSHRTNDGAGLSSGLVPHAAALLISLLAGCAAPRPDPLAEAAAARAVALGGALEFRTDGGPLDEPAAGEVLTLAEAIRRAVTTDPALQAALARVRIAMADADQARLLPNPVLGVVLKWGPGEAQIEASLAHDLIRALQTPRLASAADNRLRQAAADAVTVALDVAAEVQERYASVQALDVLAPLLAERRELMAKLTETARARLEAGEGTRTDVTVLDAQRVELDVEIGAAELARREERLRLARLIGEPSSGASWTLQPWNPPVLGTVPESRWIEAALAGRPEVQAAVWRLAALGDDAALARLSPWDEVGAGIEAERDGDWSVGPSVSSPLPIFDMGQARRARVGAEQIEARHALVLAQRRIVEEVRVAYQTLAAGRANLERIRHELVPLQQQRRSVTEDVYLVERDITPLLLAEHDLRASQALAIDAERQATVALIRLQRAVGGAGIAPTDTEPPGPDLASAPAPSLVPVSISSESRRRPR